MFSKRFHSVSLAESPLGGISRCPTRQARAVRFVGGVVSDFWFVVLTIAVFALLALIARGAERL